MSTGSSGEYISRCACVSQNQLTQNGLAHNSLGRNGLSQNGLAQHGLGQNGLTDTRLSHNDLCQNDMTQNHVSQNSLGLDPKLLPRTVWARVATAPPPSRAPTPHNQTTFSRYVKKHESCFCVSSVSQENRPP